LAFATGRELLMAERAFRGSWRQCALAVGAVLLFAGTATGQALSRQRLLASGDAKLEKGEFFEAALIASGVEDEAELSDWFESYAAKRSRLLAGIPSGTQSELLRALHAALHAQLLTGKYRAEASDVRLTLSQGDFNCLSSLALYFDLCQAAGLDVQIWLGRGHVCLCVEDQEDDLVIEPGTARWAGANSQGQPEGRQLTPVELLGKFYYNRGVVLLQSGRFAEGLELLQNSLTLDPADGDARANLVAGLNNWAAEFCRGKRYGEAASIIEAGLRLDPAFGPLRANERLVRAMLRP
jgi:tetratricopeptide (TPR) repeat protein